MTDSKKSRLANFKGNLAIGKSIPFSQPIIFKPDAPVTAKPEEPTPIAPATVKSEVPIRHDTQEEMIATVQQSFSFNEGDHEIAAQIASAIGCSLQDILSLIVKDISFFKVDESDQKPVKRIGVSKRFRIKFSQSEVSQFKSKIDPLNVKTDVVLLRNSTLNYFDSVARTALNTLKQKHGI